MLPIKQKARQTAKRAGLFAGGMVFIAVGVGFLTLAAWFQLRTGFSPAQAGLILAAAYLGIGLVLIGCARNTGPSEATPSSDRPEKIPSEAPPLMQAFLYGIQAGSRQPRSDR
jgi:hypothetical protein